VRSADELAGLVDLMYYGRTAELKDRLAEEAEENARRRDAGPAEAATDDGSGE
jgi:hypothetical protein